MNQFDYDLFVIGAGSGGVRAGWIAPSLGARVAIAESYRIGGTCVIRGCVPKKLLVYALHFAEDFRDASGFGWTVGGTTFSWPLLIENKNREIERLSELYAGLLADSGIDIIQETARLVDAHTRDATDCDAPRRQCAPDHAAAPAFRLYRSGRI